MGEIERLVADADDGTVDEEFLRHLYRGGELLSKGQMEEARGALERAYGLHPKNPKAQNLLGLTYFKLGVFDKAASVYEILVRDNPVDPTLRVNLGLVYLKQNALHRAKREFETAVDLAPDHKKAQNYLGLAYAQAGELTRARDCFVAAGSLTMAEKMERALNDGLSRPSAPGGEAASRPALSNGSSSQKLTPVADPSREVGVGIGAERAAEPGSGEGRVGEESKFDASWDQEVLRSTPPPVPPASSDEQLSMPSPEPSKLEQASAAPEAGPEAAAPGEVLGSTSAQAPLPLVKVQDDAGDCAGPAVAEFPRDPLAPAELPASGVQGGGDSATSPESNPWADPRTEEAKPPLEETSRAGFHGGQVGAFAPEEPDTWAQPQPPLAAPGLAELTRALAMSPAEGGEPFEATSEIVVVRVRQEVFTRMEGLLAASGVLSYLPEVKRFRGKATDKAFGDGERRMVRVSGHGTLVLAARDRVFVPVELAHDSAYFREDAVFAFEEAIVFENGRIPSKLAPDLHLVHLRGRGRILLCSSGPLRATAIVSAAPVAIPMGVLLGWHGSLTPRIVGLPEEREGAATIPAVELNGDGYALLASPRAAAAR